MRDRYFQIAGAVIFIFGLVFIFFSLDGTGPAKSKLTTRERLSALWKSDLQKLKGHGSLPKAWGEIGTLKLKPLSRRAKAWIKGTIAPIPVKPQGPHTLEVLVDDWEDQGDYGVVMTYQLIEGGSGELLWELGRTYVLKKKRRRPKESNSGPQLKGQKKSGQKREN
jgi:hypothetical protein